MALLVAGEAVYKISFRKNDFFQGLADDMKKILEELEKKTR
jgi:hypothetical protein